MGEEGDGAVQSQGQAWAELQADFTLSTSASMYNITFRFFDASGGCRTVGGGGGPSAGFSRLAKTK